jgi:hypothetical protein
MEYTFDDLKNKYKNIPCIIVSPGPKLKHFNYKKFKGKILCIGDSILRGRNIFNANFWVCANNEFPNPNIQWHLKIINKFKKTFFIFSDTALYDLVWKKYNYYLKKRLKVNWLAYDDRHINKKKCIPRLRCCDLIDKEKNKNNLTIQEYVSEMYNDKHICKPFGSTVAEKALAFSLILGCNPIILHGVDLPEKKINHNYSKDIYSDKIVRKVADEMKSIYRNYYFKNFYFKEYLKEIRNKIINLFSKKTVYGLNKKKTLKNFQILFNLAKKKNIKIISLNSKSSLMKLKNITYVSKDNLDEKYFI